MFAYHDTRVHKELFYALKVSHALTNNDRAEKRPHWLIQHVYLHFHKAFRVVLAHRLTSKHTGWNVKTLDLSADEKKRK
jgi:hypothetical protein